VATQPEEYSYVLVGEALLGPLEATLLRLQALGMVLVVVLSNLKREAD